MDQNASLDILEKKHISCLSLEHNSLSSNSHPSGSNVKSITFFSVIFFSWLTYTTNLSTHKLSICDILLTVHLSIILVINQLDTQNLVL